MDKKIIINKTIDFVKKELLDKPSCHGWWHAYQVWNNAKRIAKFEKANILIVELAALLHDVFDWKWTMNNKELAVKKAKIWLKTLNLDEKTVNHIINIIFTLSFKGKDFEFKMSSIEGKIVQDADRLEGIGAIGIARVFTYGGYSGREIYNPEIKPRTYKSIKEYQNNKSSSINHFYEKLLLLKDLMNTKTAKKIAVERHNYLKNFLLRFYKEWQGEV